MNQNYNNIPIVSTPVKTGNNYRYILYVFMLLTIVGCFLPFLTSSAYGLNESINYVFAGDKVKDGVYVIGLIVASFFSLRKNNYKGTIVGIGLSLGILALDYFDTQSKMDELTYHGLVDVNYGIGFYIVAIGLIGALVMAIMLNKKFCKAPELKTSTANVSVNNSVPQNITQTVMAQSVTQHPLTCHYCGGPRNVGNFCKFCGGKY